jgi:hypothetical protein
VFPVNIIHAKAEQLGLTYLVIGGHAVNWYGTPRTTLDVDFLICKEDRQKCVPSAEHLIGLKLHAIKHGPEYRRGQDLIDVVRLIRNAKIDPESESFKKLVERYGNEEIYQQILKARLPSA